MDLPGLFGAGATEGTVFPNMIDMDGSVPDTAPESDAELAARFGRVVSFSGTRRERALRVGVVALATGGRRFVRAGRRRTP